MLRRLALLVLALALLGGDAYASPAASSSDKPRKHLNAADEAWAKAIRIQRSDLGAGDWRLETSTHNSAAPPGCKDPNLSDLVLPGEAENPDWSRNGSFVGSGSEIWSNERQALVAWKRNTALPFGKCLVEGLKREIGKTPGVTLKIDSSGPISVGKPAPRIFTYGLRFRVIGARSVSGRVAFYAFGRGRADGMLTVISFSQPLTPVSQALERRLAALVAGRLRR
jgi:hypothetical protein